jgi:hypothetical protein
LPDASYGTFVAKIGKELCGMIGTLTHLSHEHNDVSGKIVALIVFEETTAQRRRSRSHCGRGKGFSREEMLRESL